MFKDAFDFLKDSDEHNKEILDDIGMNDENDTKEKKTRPKSKFDSDSDTDKSDEELSDEETGAFIPKSDNNKENINQEKKSIFLGKKYMILFK